MDAEQLRSILTNPAASASQKQAAFDALTALGEAPVQSVGGSDLSSLATELVRCSKLAEVERTSYGEPDKPLFAYVPLNEFCDFATTRNLTTAQTAGLWTEYVEAKKAHDPGWVKVFIDGQRRMREYFVERLTGLMARLRAAGKPTQAIHNEIDELLRDWQDSGVLPEDTKALMRRILEGAK
jgi:hypothetical protein